MNILELPFNQHLGLEMTTYEKQKVVCLQPTLSHTNHLGTVHAGALYSLAEAASAHALLTKLDGHGDDVLAVVRSASVKYRKPATGRLVGIGTFDEDAALIFAKHLEAKGRAFVTVRVGVRDEAGDQVAAAEFSWFLRRTGGDD